ncbi:uncharacterized protein LOC128550366 [Mercenaria mercenaria]|uniref:uncharacterized protein LOC128550366 n=1 Tax=Mercenaria mercenaria TaxID=6596 RepID=UPI00234F6111|nr:uncharacterized protein LOC128550366 [Mercenaria mercenaria]
MMLLDFFIFMLLLRGNVGENSESRRLVYHSGEDIAAEVQKLRQEIQDLRAEVTTLKQEKGSTYVRWGRTTCSGNETEKVYSGFTSGSPHDTVGGASYVCLPQHPTWAKYVDGIQDVGGYISGTEYQIYTATYSPFPQNMQDQDAPCVVCRTKRPTTLMIPGKTDCYPGWTMEYIGYLMTEHSTHKDTSNYACVDANPEAVYHGEANMNGKLFYFTEVKCGSLPCQEYPDGRELACVVCSK